jgi:hypothetical protein
MRKTQGKGLGRGLSGRGRGFDMSSITVPDRSLQRQKIVTAEVNIPPGRKVGYASSRGLDNSPGFDAKAVVHRDSQTLLAADLTLRRLY